MTKSRAEELNPSHRCQECGIEHLYIPPMTDRIITAAGQAVDAPLIPIEVTLVADGLVTFTTDTEPLISAQVPVVGMVWGVPGKPQSVCKSILVLN